MTIKTLRDRLAQESGVTNVTRLDWAIRLALASVEDIREGVFNVLELEVTDSAVDVVMPYTVADIIGIKMEMSNSLELTSLTERFHAYSSIPEMIQATEIGITYTDRPITTAGVIKFQASFTSAENCAISLFGKSVIGDQVEETILLIPGTTVQTVQAYIEITSLSKSVAVPYNVLVKQVDNTQIGTIPGGYLEAPRKILRFPYAGTFLILHRLAIPDSLPGGMILDNSVDRVVYFEALQQLNMDKVAAVDPTVFRAQAKSIYTAAAQRNARGKVNTINWGAGSRSRQGYV